MNFWENVGKWVERRKYWLFKRLASPDRRIRLYLEAVLDEYEGKNISTEILNEVTREMTTFVTRVYYPDYRVVVCATRDVFTKNAIKLEIDVHKRTNMDKVLLTLQVS